MLTKRGFMMRIRPIFVFMLIIGHVLGANLRVSAQIKANNPTLLQVSTLTPTPIIQVTREQAAALSTEGDRLLARNEFLLALDYYQEALSIYRTIHDRAGEVQTLIKIGNIYQNLGYYSEALRYYQESWPEGISQTPANVGVYVEGGDYQKALRYLQEALSQYETTGDQRGRAAALLNIGRIYNEIGEYAKAVQYYEEALEICPEIDSQKCESTALHNLGASYIQLSEYQKALEYLFQALYLRQTLNDLTGEVNTLNSIGTVYFTLGDYMKAVEYSLEAYDISKEIEYRVGEANSLNSVALVLSTIGRFQEAVGYLEQALILTRDMHNNIGVATILSNIGANYYLLGEYAKAIDYFQQALVINQTIGYRAGDAVIYTYLGAIYIELGNPVKGVDYYQQALNINREINNRTAEATTLGDIALIYYKQSDLELSLDYILQAINVIESIHSGIQAEELQVTFTAGISYYYSLAVKLLMELGRTSEAFEYSERGRARAFLTLLGNQHVNPLSNENPALVQDETQLRKELAVLETNLHEVSSQPYYQGKQQVIESVTADLNTKRGEYEKLLDQMQFTNPEYASLVSVTPLTLEEAQILLQEQVSDITLVSYFVGKEETFIFIVGPGVFQAVVTHVSRQELHQQADELLAQMRAEPLRPDAWQKPAQALYGWLISPIEPFLPPPNQDNPPLLGIIPHDLLHYIPFSVLEIGENSLLQDYTLFYTPSVSSLKFIFEKRHPDPSTLLAIANPDAPGSSHLSHVVDEVQSVANLYQAQPLLNLNATEQALKTQAGEYGIVHIAAHSNYNPQKPLFSAILLQPSETEDGRLEVHEIINLSLPQTDLVVLSACQTHLGELSAGDELVGLERAFLRAGTPSLLTTLWPVDDAVTAELMENFYTQLKSGVPKAEALRLAQMETRLAHDNPYYWAGFILVGDAGVKQADIEKNHCQLEWVFVLLLITLVGIIFSRWKRRRQLVIG